KTRIVMVSSFLRALVVLSLVAVCGAAGGPNWACVGAGIGFVIHNFFLIVVGGRVSGLPTGAYLRGVARPLLPLLPLFFAVRAGRVLSGGAAPVLALHPDVLRGARGRARSVGRGRAARGLARRSDRRGRRGLCRSRVHPRPARCRRALADRPRRDAPPPLTLI